MILVLIDYQSEQIANVSFEILSKAKAIGNANGSPVAAMLMGTDSTAAVDTLTRYADVVMVNNDERLGEIDSQRYIECLKWVIEEKQPEIVLMSHSCHGVEIAPYLAADLQLPLAMNCIDVEVGKGGAKVTRQVYGGKLNANLSIRGDRFIATIRPGAFRIEKETSTEGQVLDITCPLKTEPGKKRLLGVVKKVGGDIDIAKAEVVVGVGRGLKRQEDLIIAENLARSMGGVVACSRPIVDKGWLTHDRQVGSSGKIIHPKVYIALGISGAYQHLDGMRSCELIISINQDPYAPISSVAHYAVIDDLYEIVPKITSIFMETGP